MNKKKPTGMILALLLISILTWASNIQPFNAEPGTIKVPDDYPTIQEAINAANIGDTVFVYKGTYPENVVVNKTVTLVGEDRESTIINGMGTYTVVNVTANDVVVSNFTILNGYHLVYLHYSDDNTISNTTLTNGSSEAGILLDHSNNNMVANNTVYGIGGTGIYLYHSSGNTVSHNNSTNNLIGMWLLYSNDNPIIENNVAKNKYGFRLSYSGGNTLRNNEAADNTYNFGVHGVSLTQFIQDIDTSNKVNGKPIYYWVNKHGMQIPSDAGYVAAVNSTNVTVKNLDLRSNRECVLLAYTTNCAIEGNSISNCSQSAIHIYNSNDNKIDNNTITNARDGVLLDNSNGNTVSNNVITDCVEYGIWLHYSPGNTISSTATTNNWIGIILYYSDSNSLYDNNATENSYGIWISYSNNNNIYHNRFNNTEQVYSHSSVNVWDDGYPSGGNFWSDYTGQDLDGDGIGDTPYVIDANNQDNYPLMAPDFVTVPGDITGPDDVPDGIVDIYDLVFIQKAYGKTETDPNWNEYKIADITGPDGEPDGIVDIYDLDLCSKNYGKTA